MLVSGKDSAMYRLGGVLGQGAMGIVYRAEQLDARGTTIRAVAFKTIRPDLLESRQELAERFRQEIAAAARLRGTHTVTVYDFGETAAGDLYYAMELLSGRTLRHIFDESGPLAPTLMVESARQICAALGEAHGLPRPVVHRDLKPANVLIERWDEDPCVKVGDFGVARIVDDNSRTRSQPPWSAGTPRYMAPEQCRGAAVDGRADLYALGVLVYEGLSGRPPFVGDPMAVLWQHLHQAPEPLPDSVPEPLRRAIAHLLEKDPDRRPPNAAAAAHELAAAVAPLRVTDPPAVAARVRTSAAIPSPGARRGLRRAVLAAALAIVVGALAGALVFGRSTLDGALRRSSLPAVPLTGNPVDPGPANVPDRRTYLAVLKFSNAREADTENEWMGNALQASFTTELDKVRDIGVVSRESVNEADGEAEGVLAAARLLGAQKLVAGSFAVHRDRIRIDAWLIDTQSGLHEMAETAEGTIDEFFTLQKGLALAMLKRLPVAVGREERAAIESGNRSDNPAAALDAYRLMLQGEGFDEEDAEPSPTDSHSRPTASARTFAAANSFGTTPGWLAVAHAAEEPEGSEEEVRRALEAYRRALERGDLDAIRATRGGLSPRRRQGLEQYFQMAEDLRVEFDGIELSRLSDDRYAVWYVRRDEFSDRHTGERVSLEVRLENVAVRSGDRWILRNKKGSPAL